MVSVLDNTKIEPESILAQDLPDYKHVCGIVFDQQNERRPPRGFGFHKIIDRRRVRRNRMWILRPEWNAPARCGLRAARPDDGKFPARSRCPDTGHAHAAV